MLWRPQYSLLFMALVLSLWDFIRFVTYFPGNIMVWSRVALSR